MQTIELEKEKRPKIFASKEEMSQELTPLLECRLESKKNCMVVKLGFPAAETAIDRVYAVYGMLPDKRHKDYKWNPKRQEGWDIEPQSLKVVALGNLRINKGVGCWDLEKIHCKFYQ